MNIQHISLCTTEMDRMVKFYKRYFGAVEHSTYQNDSTGLRICNLQLDKGPLIEVTTRPGFVHKPPERGMGYVHIALDVGRPEDVDFLTGRMADDGVTVVGPPRRTGYGYYGSTVADPDGNWVEIVSTRAQAGE